MLYPLSYQAIWIDRQLRVRDIPDDSEIHEYEYMKIIYVCTADGLTFESYSVTIQMEVIAEYFPVLLFISQYFLH